jgi:hypothetical protein
MENISDNKNAINDDNEDDIENLGKKTKNNISNDITGNEYDNDNLENLASQQDSSIKNGAIITSLFCIISIIIAMFSNYGENFLIFNNKNNLYLNKYILNLYLLFFLISNTLLIVFLSFENEQKNLRKILYKNLRWYFILTQGFFGCIFLIGSNFGKYDWAILFCITLSMTVIILLAFYYEDIKLKKDMTIDTIISVFIYLSLLFAFISHITLYYFGCIVDSNSKDFSYINIAICSFQTFIGIVNLTYFKDLFFAVGSFLIQLGNIIEIKNPTRGEKITLITCLSFLLISSLLVSFRYKGKVIGTEEENKLAT